MGLRSDLETQAGLRQLSAAVLNSLASDPARGMTELVASASLVFYWAEAGLNEDVKTYWDAFHYIATCLSVGYARIFPVTPVGKIVGGIVMMVGPALSARALEGAAESHGDTAVVARLDAILAELRSQRSAS
jgi:hypothetical protein